VPSITIPGPIWKIRRKKPANDPVWWKTRSPERKESHVEDRDEKTGTDPEIETHRKRGPLPRTNEEAPVEDSDEDVEAHKRRDKKLTDERDESGSDDVELHRMTRKLK
jgi:hypothetical protein